MADVELLVEVRELAPGILRKKRRLMASAAPIGSQRGPQERSESLIIRVVQDRFVAGHELQLVEQPNP